MFCCLRQDLHNLLLPPVLNFSIKYSAGIEEEGKAKGTTAQPSDKEDTHNFLLSQNKELEFMYPCQKEDYCHSLYDLSASLLKIETVQDNILVDTELRTLMQPCSKD